MLVYHPAFDLHHGMFRLLRLFHLNPSAELHFDAYRILDFYYLFPDLLKEARLPSTMTARKRAFGKLESKYSRVPSPRMFISQMNGIHETICRSLVGKGFLDRENFEGRILSRTEKLQPSKVVGAFEAGEVDSELVQMLAIEMAAIPLSGKNGLKVRTGLLEHRYDAA